jgi:hypothetical protein
MGIRTVAITQTDARTATELFRSHGCNVYVEESAFDGGGLDWNYRGLVADVGTGRIDCVGHGGSD